MQKFEEYLEKILVPFREEYRQKCKNDSVIGGFDKYAINWLDRALSVCPARADVKERLKVLREKFVSYPRLLPGQRKEALKEVHWEIKEILSGSPLPSGNLRKGQVEKKRTNKSKIVHRDKQKKPGPLESVRKLGGVGPRLEQILARMNIYTIEDLLFYTPREYRDLRKIRSPNNLKIDEFQAVKGTLGKVYNRRLRKKLTITKSVLYDENGSISLVWFNQPYVRRLLKPGEVYVARGKVEYRRGQVQINSPEMKLFKKENLEKRMVPIYPVTEGISSKFLQKIISSAVAKYADSLVEVFPEDFLRRLNLMPINVAIKALHAPDTPEEAERALLKLRFEEAFFLELILAGYRRKIRQKVKKDRYDINRYLVKEFEDSLPFEFTDAQRRVIDEILDDMLGPHPMNRLLQGDVGSGKTIICIFCTLAAARSGFQSAVLAPTEILAEQHYYRFREHLDKMGVRTELLIGSTHSKKKEEIKRDLQKGEVMVVVGTHALIQEDVNFKNLRFGVIDEQHKFGVMQRATLKEKGDTADFLFTTATPIPRSLCLTLYGDLDVSIIDEIPPGRQPVKTMQVYPRQKEKVWQLVEREIEQGGQAYVICPLIEESEKLEATALEVEYEKICQRFPHRRVQYIHGRMSGEEKETIMNDFARGEYDILVCTTVVEVGVDVPGATVMVILDAHRYGLGQLHQLRGRVGRGEKKSYCILLANPSGDSAKRLATLLKTDSGFEIAEEDLKIRGPGDFVGLRQSGLPSLRFVDVLRDYKIIAKARQEAFRLEKEDPQLLKKEYSRIKDKLKRKYKKIWDIIH